MEMKIMFVHVDAFGIACECIAEPCGVVRLPDSPRRIEILC